MVFGGSIATRFDTDNDEWVVSCSGEPTAPSTYIEHPIEGQGDTLSEALRDLADQLETC